MPARRPPRLARRAYSTAAPAAATKLNMLVVEAYPREGRERLASENVRRASDTFSSLLHEMAPADHAIDIERITPADSAAHVAEVGELERFDGVVWTGSSLTIHEDVPEVRRQVELARRCFEAGVPQYGSCWGLQVAATAAGIPCEANPRGREHGLSRDITLTPAGLRHPMYDGTMRTFDALAAHTDQVAARWAMVPTLPAGVSAQILASNEWSPVQALSVRIGAGEFWGVQYHPELSVGDVGRLMRLPLPRRLLLAQGCFADEVALEEHAAQLIAIDEAPAAHAELCAKLRIGDDLLDPARRSRELANWLQHLVLPTKARDLVHMRGARQEARAPKLARKAFLARAAAPPTTTTALEVDNPYSGAVAARVPLLPTADAVAQVVAAAGAQREWAAETRVEERVALCARFLDALEADADRIAAETSVQMGKPLAAARAEVRGVRERAEAMMALAPAALAAEALPEKPNFLRRIEKVPVGVVLCIAPWNYPLLTAVNCVVPAVLAGNAVQLKHSPRSPLAADAFERAFLAAGAPRGLVQALHCDNEAVGAAIGLPEVGFVSFTGSVGVGHKVHELVARRFIDSTLELGGKCAAYVAADADVAVAAASLVDGAFYNAGQSCCAIERVYCHSSVHDEFVERALELVRAYRMGDPLDEATTLGPLALPGAPALLAAQVADATAKGARLLCGGGATADEAGAGRFFAPALLDRCDDASMSLMRDESFGPVLGVASVSSDAEAVHRMNDTAYGLTACVFTADVGRAERIASLAQAGTVFMNRCDYLDPLLPWGGVKHTGKGVSLSAHGFRSFTRLKGINFKLDPHGQSPPTAATPPAAPPLAAAAAAAAAAGHNLLRGGSAATEALPAVRALGWEVVPTAEALGAELLGPDLSRLGANELAAIREALLAYEVLFFREQHGFAPEHHRALAAHFGGFQHHPAYPHVGDPVDRYACNHRLRVYHAASMARQALSTACVCQAWISNTHVHLLCTTHTRKFRQLRWTRTPRSPFSRTTVTGPRLSRSGTPT